MVIANKKVGAMAPEMVYGREGANIIWDCTRHSINSNGNIIGFGMLGLHG